MKTISKEEFEKLRLVPNRMEHPVYIACMKLKVGEILKVEQKEWKFKGGIKTALGNYEYKMGMRFSVKKLKNDGGWAVIRVD